jgi:dihydroflavonol-4-reductase
VLAAAAAQPNPPVVVLISSLAAVGPAPRGRLRVESDPICPISLYGRSKRAGELAAEEFADRVPITVVRPGIVFGQGDRMSLPLFTVPASSRIHMVPGYFPHRFSFIHVDDLAQILVRVAEKGNRLVPGAQSSGCRSPGYYFAADDQHPTYYELGTLIGQALGKYVVSVPWALVAVWIAAVIHETNGRLTHQLVHVSFDKAREASAGAWNCDARSTWTELGYRPPFSLAERLQQTVQWYRGAGWL